MASQESDPTQPSQRKKKPSPPLSLASTTPQTLAVTTPSPIQSFPTQSKPLRPKRGIKTIFEEYQWDPEFPPTLAQLIDRFPDEQERNKTVHQYKFMLSIDQAWRVAEMYDNVLKAFPRAFDHDLSEEDQRYVQLLIEMESSPSLCSPTIQLVTLFGILAIFVTTLSYFLIYNINLFWFLHLTLKANLARVQENVLIRPPSLLQVLLHPEQYRFKQHEDDFLIQNFAKNNQNNQIDNQIDNQHQHLPQTDSAPPPQNLLNDGNNKFKPLDSEVIGQ
jgi:hypothetical protein